MSDEQIKAIIKEERRKAKKQELLNYIGDAVCWLSLLFIGFMLSVIG